MDEGMEQSHINDQLIACAASEYVPLRASQRPVKVRNIETVAFYLWNN